MVILRGIVRSGTQSTEDGDSYITTAEIVQLSSSVFTSSNGTFYTSALTLDIATCKAPEYATVTYSIPDFATIYDPSGVISGSITSIDTSSHVGVTIIHDTNKIFVIDSLVGRILTMMTGIDDGKTASIISNSKNSIDLGGSSGAVPAGWI